MQLTQHNTRWYWICVVLLFPFLANGTEIDSLKQLIAGAKQDTVRIKLLLEATRTCLDKGMVKESLGFAQQALPLTQRLDDDNNERLTVLSIGNIYYHMGVLDSSMIFYRQYLGMCEGPDEISCKVDAYNNIALVYNMYYQLDSALAMYQQSAGFAEVLKDTNRLALVSSNMGIIYGQQYKLTKALEYFEKARAYAQAKGNKRMEVISLINIGRAYIERGEYAIAQTFLDEALQLTSQSSRQDLAPDIFQYLGMAAFKQNQDELAIDYYARALEGYDSLDAQVGTAEVNRRIAEVYLRKNDFNVAINFCEKTLDFGEKMGLNEFVEDCYKILAACYSNLQRYDDAFAYSEKYIELHDSLFSETMQQRMAEMETKFETQRKEAENEYLKVQTEQQQNIISQRTYLAWAIGAILLLVGVLAWVFYRNSRKERILNLSLEKVVDERTQALQLSNRQLIEKNKELKSFAYIASHDMKEPIRNISVFTSLVERGLKDIADAETMEYFHSIKSNTEHMHTLVQDVLAFSTLSDKQIQFEKIDMNGVMGKVLFTLDQLIKEKKAQIRYANLPVIKSSRAQLFLILKNLVENGIKYNESSPPVIEIQCTEEEGMHHLIVKDNGIGIPEDYHDHVFEIFKRLHNQEKYQGTGIGLAICRKIISRLGGRIELESKVGKGSAFHCFIPIK